MPFNRLRAACWHLGAVDEAQLIGAGFRVGYLSREEPLLTLANKGALALDQALTASGLRMVVSHGLGSLFRESAPTHTPLSSNSRLAPPALPD